MQSLAILIPIALILVSVAVALFLWAVRSNQYEDLDRRGSDILFDDDMPRTDREERSGPNGEGGDG